MQLNYDIIQLSKINHFWHVYKDSLKSFALNSCQITSSGTLVHGKPQHFPVAAPPDPCINIKLNASMIIRALKEGFQGYLLYDKKCDQKQFC